MTTKRTFTLDAVHCVAGHRVAPHGTAQRRGGRCVVDLIILSGDEMLDAELAGVQHVFEAVAGSSMEPLREALRLGHWLTPTLGVGSLLL